MHSSAVWFGALPVDKAVQLPHVMVSRACDPVRLHPAKKNNYTDAVKLGEQADADFCIVQL